MQEIGISTVVLFYGGTLQSFRLAFLQSRKISIGRRFRCFISRGCRVIAGAND